MVERDVVGGAAHLWDCIPSKTMIATGGAIAFTRRIQGMGLEQQEAEVDIDALTERIANIQSRLKDNTTQLLESQGVALLKGSARLVGPHEVEVTTGEGVRVLPAEEIGQADLGRTGDELRDVGVGLRVGERDSRPPLLLPPEQPHGPAAPKVDRF